MALVRADLLGRDTGFRRRISIQVWLTVLFLFVTAFAAGTAYSIVYPRLEGTLERLRKDSFEQVFDQFRERIQTSPRVDEQYISFYAINRGLEWGVVSGEDGQALRGDPGDFDPDVVEIALRGKHLRPTFRVESGDREGQTLATFAAPIRVSGGETEAIVFTKYYGQSEILNAVRVPGAGSTVWRCSRGLWRY